MSRIKFDLTDVDASKVNVDISGFTDNLQGISPPNVQEALNVIDQSTASGNLAVEYGDTSSGFYQIVGMVDEYLIGTNSNNLSYSSSDFTTSNFTNTSYSDLLTPLSFITGGASRALVLITGGYRTASTGTRAFYKLSVDSDTGFTFISENTLNNDPAKLVSYMSGVLNPGLHSASIQGRRDNATSYSLVGDGNNQFLVIEVPESDLSGPLTRVFQELTIGNINLTTSYTTVASQSFNTGNRRCLVITTIYSDQLSSFSINNLVALSIDGGPEVVPYLENCNGDDIPVTRMYLTDVLSAGSHQISLRACMSSGSAVRNFPKVVFNIVELSEEDSEGVLEYSIDSYSATGISQNSNFATKSIVSEGRYYLVLNQGFLNTGINGTGGVELTLDGATFASSVITEGTSDDTYSCAGIVQVPVGSATFAVKNKSTQTVSNGDLIVIELPVGTGNNSGVADILMTNTAGKALITIQGLASTGLSGGNIVLGRDIGIDIKLEVTGATSVTKIFTLPALIEGAYTQFMSGNRFTLPYNISWLTAINPGANTYRAYLKLRGLPSHSENTAILQQGFFQVEEK